MATIALPDGRDLELEVSGPEDGPVIVFHHGTPGASTPLPAHVEAAATGSSPPRGPGTPRPRETPGGAWPTWPTTPQRCWTTSASTPASSWAGLAGVRTP